MNEVQICNGAASREIRKLTGSNDFYFMENQALTRRVSALKRSEARLNELHAGEIQAKNEKILRLREIVTSQDKQKQKLRTRIEKLKTFEEQHLQEKHELQALADRQSNTIKTLERKLEIQKSRIADFEANISLDENRGRAYWLVEQANSLIADLEGRNDALVKDLETMTKKYETEKEYTTASRPLLEIGAVIRTRYVYDKLLGLGIIGEMPRFILPAANRYVHWADMTADLALFKTGLWTIQNEGAFFKAVYPGHTVESCMNLEKRSHKSTLTFMGLRIMYNDLHRPGRDFGLKGFPCSEKFQELQEELQDYIASRSSVRTAEIGTTPHEDKYIKLKLCKMMDLMAAFRRAEDTKLALSWLARDGKGTYLTKENQAVSDSSSKGNMHTEIYEQKTTKATAAAWFTRTRKAISEIVTPTMLSTPPGIEIAFHTPIFRTELRELTENRPRHDRRSMGQESKGFVEMYLESQAALHPAQDFGLRDPNTTGTKHKDWKSGKGKELEELEEIEKSEMSDEGLFIVPVDKSRRAALNSERMRQQPLMKDPEAVCEEELERELEV